MNNSLYVERNRLLQKKRDRKRRLYSLAKMDALEKRFTQFKSVHEAAPLLFKKIERVEGIMFLFFLSLMIQAVIERQVRLKMKQWRIKTLSIYPESREAYHPTTSKILDAFAGISSYKVRMGQMTKKFRDPLTKTQEQILNLLGISSDHYWGRSAVEGEKSKKTQFQPAEVVTEVKKCVDYCKNVPADFPVRQNPTAER